MALCIDNNIRKRTDYQTVFKQSGISQFAFDAYLSKFLEANGRMPELNEIPGADSKSYLLDVLSSGDRKINYRGENTYSMKLSDLANAVGNVNTPEAIQVYLNNTYKDKLITVTPLFGETVILRIDKRPSRFNSIRNPEKWEDVLTSNFQKSDNGGFVISNLISRLSELHGIKINTTNTSEIKSKFSDLVGDANTVKAFIYNGEIYVNTTTATLDSPIHEFMHILLGSVKYTHNNMYTEILGTLQDTSSFKKFSESIHNRSREDLLEEYFVQEFSKYMAGMESDMDTLMKTPNIKNTIMNDMYWIIDTMLNGNTSSEVLGMNVTGKSLNDLCTLLESAVNMPGSYGTLNRYSSEISRIANNEKSKLMQADITIDGVKHKKLEFIC